MTGESDWSERFDGPHVAPQYGCARIAEPACGVGGGPLYNSEQVSSGPPAADRLCGKV